MTDYIDALFNNLDLWRHLPAYQLERRADAFFSVYLPELLQVRYGAIPQAIIPEFPVHIPTISPKASANRSFKIDYLAILPTSPQYVFVELKTDTSSRRPGQDQYLKKAANVGLPSLLRGLQRICQATSAKSMYDALLRHLQSAGLITLTAPGRFDINASSATPQLLYIQPHRTTDDSSTLDFMEIATLLSKNPDSVSQRFAKSLAEWASTKPGSHGVVAQPLTGADAASAAGGTRTCQPAQRS